MNTNFTEQDNSNDSNLDGLGIGARFKRIKTLPKSQAGKTGMIFQAVLNLDITDRKAIYEAMSALESSGITLKDIEIALKSDLLAKFDKEEMPIILGSVFNTES